MKKEPCSIFLSAKGRCFHRKNIGMKSVLFTILLQYTIFRRNFQENFFFFFYRKSELKSFSSGLCGASGFRLACSPSHVGVSCRTTPCGSALFAGSRPAPRRPLLKKGSIRKLFLRTDNILFMERHRIRNAGTVDFWVTVYGYRSPSPLWVFCAFVHGGRHLPKALGFSTMPPACTT